LNNKGGNLEAGGSQSYKGDSVPRVVGESYHGKEVKWQMENVFGLHRFMDDCPG